jgi:hypothetical protein
MFPENHAAPVPPWPGQDLPRTAPAPAHMAAPMTDGRPTSSPERNCRTLQGPSAKEWARHRDTIIDLYKQYPLKRVNEIMKRHHGFSARYACLSSSWSKPSPKPRCKVLRMGLQRTPHSSSTPNSPTNGSGHPSPSPPRGCPSRIHRLMSHEVQESTTILSSTAHSRLTSALSPG